MGVLHLCLYLFLILLIGLHVLLSLISIINRIYIAAFINRIYERRLGFLFFLVVDWVSNQCSFLKNMAIILAFLLISWCIHIPLRISSQWKSKKTNKNSPMKRIYMMEKGSKIDEEVMEMCLHSFRNLLVNGGSIMD